MLRDYAYKLPPSIVFSFAIRGRLIELATTKFSLKPYTKNVPTTPQSLRWDVDDLDPAPAAVAPEHPQWQKEEHLSAGSLFQLAKPMNGPQLGPSSTNLLRRTRFSDMCQVMGQQEPLGICSTPQASSMAKFFDLKLIYVALLIPFVFSPSH